jgi:hypothetical protein
VHGGMEMPVGGVVMAKVAVDCGFFFCTDPKLQNCVQLPSLNAETQLKPPPGAPGGSQRCGEYP